MIDAVSFTQIVTTVMSKGAVLVDRRLAERRTEDNLQSRSLDSEASDPRERSAGSVIGLRGPRVSR
jgi:hypothetical protein